MTAEELARIPGRAHPAEDMAPRPVPADPRP
jgi:hypothetical protein